MSLFHIMGTPLPNAVAQMERCMRTADYGALMADHHLGYAVPIGGVLGYVDAISPSGVGYDIGCGNKAVLTDAKYEDVVYDLEPLMDTIAASISFGVGRKNAERVDHALFDSETWNDEAIAGLKDMAREQLGTVGSGNHYIDIFVDEERRIWIGCHFGSRGLGHKTATYFLKAGGAKDGIDVDPLVLSTEVDLGKRYLACMELAGRYAYAGRDWVCSKVASILGAKILDEVHNHHNYAWKERHAGHDLWVVRKGATPAFPGQKGFVGATMGEQSVILEGVDSPLSRMLLMSTVHGAGRVMSRTEAAGKSKWIKGVKTRVAEGKISRDMMMDAIGPVILRGGGTDEAPQAYKRLDEVLVFHAETIHVIHRLTPLGVAMAGENEVDPYKD